MLKYANENGWKEDAINAIEKLSTENPVILSSDEQITRLRDRK